MGLCCSSHTRDFYYCIKTDILNSLCGPEKERDSFSHVLSLSLNSPILPSLHYILTTLAMGVNKTFGKILFKKLPTYKSLCSSTPHLSIVNPIHNSFVNRISPCKINTCSDAAMLNFAFLLHKILLVLQGENMPF